jgi:DNA polymerase-3 subunit delta'
MSDDALPEPDRVEGAPHPRETERLYGHDRRRGRLSRRATSGRLHHAWLITGPRGAGKATLAWRLARYLLATPAAADRRRHVRALRPARRRASTSPPTTRSPGGCGRCRSPGCSSCAAAPNDKGDRLSAEIRVDEVRKLKGFFSLSAADNGRRVVIVDCADEMNTAAANAVLKLLEEPPRRCGAAPREPPAQPPASDHPLALPRAAARAARPRRPGRRARPGAGDISGARRQAAEASPILPADRSARRCGSSISTGWRSTATSCAVFEPAPRYDRPRAIALANSAAGAAQ